jgi:hypothetical protein
MGRRERFRYYAAWFFTVLGLPAGLFFVLAVLGAFLLVAYDALAAIF